MPRANTRAVTAGLFETLGVQLLEGRFFTDNESSPEYGRDGRRPAGSSACGRGRAPSASGCASARPRPIAPALSSASSAICGFEASSRTSRRRSSCPIASGSAVRWPTSSRPIAIRPRSPLTCASAVAAVDSRLPIYDVRTMDTYVAGRARDPPLHHAARGRLRDDRARPDVHRRLRRARVRRRDAPPRVRRPPRARRRHTAGVARSVPRGPRLHADWTARSAWPARRWPPNSCRISSTASTRATRSPTAPRSR